MYNLKKLIVCMAGAAFALNLHAQQVQGFVHKQSEATDYVWPTDQQVLDKLDKMARPEVRSLVSLGTLFRSRHCRVMVHLLGRCRLDFTQKTFAIR